MKSKTMIPRITDEEFNDMLTDKVTRLEKFVDDNHESLGMPVLEIAMKDVSTEEIGHMIVGLGADMNDPDERYKAMHLAGMKVATTHEIRRAGLPVATFLISEAWMARMKKDEVDTGKRPSEYENKEEVMIVTGRTYDGRTNIATIPMIRKETDFDHLTFGEKKLMLYEKDSKEHGESYLLAKFYEGYVMGFLTGEEPKSGELLNFDELKAKLDEMKANEEKENKS